MLSNIYFFYLSIFALTFSYWSIPAKNIINKKICICLFSILFVALVSPILCITLIYYCFTLFILSKFKIINFTLGLLLLIVPLIAFRLTFSDDLYVNFGLAFLFIRTYYYFYKIIYLKNNYNFLDSLLYITFFPVFFMGPVENPQTFNKNLKNNFNINNIFIFLKRNLIGIFYIYVLSDGIFTNLKLKFFFNFDNNISNYETLEVFIYIGINFLTNLFNFIGVIHIIIGSAALISFKLIENFNNPLISSNVSEFWTRYHISMGNFVRSNIFIPIFSLTQNIFFSPIFAFMIFGLWHSFTLNYLIWGLMHGLALSTYLQIRKKIISINIKIISYSLKVSGIIFTFFYVSFLQTFANLNSFSKGLDLFFSILPI